MKLCRFISIIFLIPLTISCSSNSDDSPLECSLWYEQPAEKWGDAFPLGNGRIAAMCFGGTTIERFQINEESLWAGSKINPYAKNYRENLTKVQEMVLDENYAKAHDFGVENLTAKPTSFRSYEPLTDLLIEFTRNDSVLEYKRELNLATGICEVSYLLGETKFVQESFISAVDDVLCIRIAHSGKEKLNFLVGMNRFKDARFMAFPEGKINMDGQIVDVEAPDAFDDNPGGSGPGGKHMKFSGRLLVKSDDGEIEAGSDKLAIRNASEVILIFTAATDYNLSKLNFDRSIDPAQKAEETLKKASQKSWKQLKDAHVNDHRNIFNRVSLDLGTSVKDTLPTNKRIEAFKNGTEDNGLIAQMFQFGRYLLMNSSREPAVLPANLQGKWSEEIWAPWEADYHLNVNMQMNYWPADVTNLSETAKPMINWFELITETSKPIAGDMYNADGWFACLASNPFGRVTPSASTIESQFNNGVLDPLAGAWMLMNLWDHYGYSQEMDFLQYRLFPLLKGASSFILDVLVPDEKGTLHFVPSESPENSYIDDSTGRSIRISATSTYHLSIIKAVFKATLEAVDILNIDDPISGEILGAEKLLPEFPVSPEGRLLEWQKDLKESEPGHRHLSHLLGVHPFALITEQTPEIFSAARQAMDWRNQNGHGFGGRWKGAHAALMYAWIYEGDLAYDNLSSIMKGLDNSLLNASGRFQIDANFGATSTIAEMLIQSHLKDQDGNFIIHLLPALPSAWSDGEVKGLKVRGNSEVDIFWKNGRLLNAIIRPGKSGALTIRNNNRTYNYDAKKGEEISFTAE